MKTIVLSILAVLTFAIPVMAREVNNPSSSTPDAWCAYGGGSYSGGNVTGAEACLDYNGNWMPTVTNAQTSGTSLLLWSNVYSTAFTGVNATLTGNQTLGAVGTGNSTGTGQATMPTASTVIGSFVMPSTQEGSNSGAAFGIFASTTIPVLGAYEQLLSSATNGGNIKITSTPSISTVTVPSGNIPIPDGTFLVLTSTAANVITLQSQGTLSGSGLRLGAATRAITIGNTLTLVWSKALGQWIEVAFSAGTGN